MKSNLIATLFASLLVVATNVLSQTPADKPLVGTKSPQEPVPGVILRVHLGPFTRDHKANPTHLLCVVQSGKEWFDKYKDIAAGELRGVTKSSELHYVGACNIVVDKDTELVFDVKDGMCMVGGKDFGHGTFRHTFKKGKYAVEFFAGYGHGQPPFEASGANGEKVLFYTQEMLTRELNRSVKVEGKTYKSKMMSEAPEPKR